MDNSECANELGVSTALNLLLATAHCFLS